MLVAALREIPLSAFFTAGVVGIVVPWCLRLPRLALAALCAALVLGQTVRLPLPGQSGGVLPSDVAVILVLLAALWQGIRQRTLPPHTQGITTYYLLLTTPFICWSLFSLVLNLGNLETSEFLIALSYWLRLSTHVLLLPALLLLFQNAALRTFAQRALLAAAGLLTLLGLAQFFFLPQVSDIMLALPAVAPLGGAKAGWDPHQNRLVATWLDPNFFGAFLAMIVPWVISIQISKHKSQTKHERSLGFVWYLCGLIIVALTLTQSRSAILALALAVLLLSPAILAFTLRTHARRRAATVASVAVLMLLITVLGSILLRHRLLGLLTVDATVATRLESLRSVWHVAQQHTLFGVGYNAYQFAARDNGLIKDFSLHSRAGADSSYLTLWVTTGLAGLLLFLLPVAGSILALWRQWWQKSDAAALAALLALGTLVFHANFINSLLYSHLVITLFLIIAMPLSRPQH